METTLITPDELTSWGIRATEDQEKFLRISNGLIQNGVMPKEQIIRNFLELLQDTKKYAKNKGKFHNLAQYILKRKEAGQDFTLSETGNELLNKFALQTVKYQREKLNTQVVGTFDLNPKPEDYVVYGKEGIEDGAYNQMNIAMRLPVSLAGALMPDAHQGYGLPIGGVLATRPDTIIPYAVGVDIACRMCMSIFDIDPEKLSASSEFKKILLDNTYFGAGASTRRKFSEDLFDKPEWEATKVIRDLKYKAYEQLGTSGTGNHFVEWGVLEVNEEDSVFGVPKGNYTALLSHSGSRGFGGIIAGHYSKLAMQKTILPAEAKHLAWLDLGSEEGMEYWIAMNLAGDYASANHHEIHNKIARALSVNPLKRIENHHNFAWKETLGDGRQVMVHRKGATPASVEELGIIPGSMTQPGFVIRGKGNADSIKSASHGAGRKMSRTKAFETISKAAYMQAIEEAGIQLIGSDLDEAPMAYKDIYGIMQSQQDLVTVLAKFTPKIVRMAEGREKAED